MNKFGTPISNNVQLMNTIERDLSPTPTPRQLSHLTGTPIIPTCQASSSSKPPAISSSRAAMPLDSSQDSSTLSATNSSNLNHNQKAMLESALKSDSTPENASIATNSGSMNTNTPKILDVLEERVALWKSMVQNLARYFEMKVDSTKKHADVMNRCSNVIDLSEFKSKKDSRVEFGKDSDINKILDAMKEHDLTFYSKSKQAAASIELSCIEVLGHLGNEIKHESKELRREESRDSDKDADKEQTRIQDLKRAYVDTLMNTKQKLMYVMNLKNKTKSSDIVVEEPIASFHTDPWILNNDIQYRLSLQEHNLEKVWISRKRIQDQYAAFEMNLVTELKKVLFTYAHSEMESDQEGTKDVIQQHIENLNGEKEFGILCETCPDQLIGTQDQKFDKSALFAYPGYNDPAVDIFHEGLLSFRKSVLLTKSWKREKCVITGTGYLHAFEKDQKFRKMNDIASEETANVMTKYEPELTICLSDCILNNYPMLAREGDELELVEMTGKPGLFTKANVTHTLKCTNELEAIEWHKIICQFTRVENYGFEGKGFNEIEKEKSILGVKEE